MTKNLLREFAKRNNNALKTVVNPCPTGSSGAIFKIKEMNINTLKVGDLIVRQKGPFSTHFMVYVGMQNGLRMVAENQSGIGVRFTTLKNALSGNSIKRFERFGGSDKQRRLVIPRIKKLLGKSYDLVVFNCEHFARWIANGKVESRQVKVASNIAIAGGIAMLASNNGAIKTLGVFSILSGIAGHSSQR